MSDPIILTVTDAARRNMLSYEKSGLEINFSHVSLGAGNYQQSKNTDNMQMAWGDFPIIQSHVNEENNSLNLLILGRVDGEKTASEIGLYGDDGSLFAVASKPAGYYFKTQSNIYFTFSLSVVLDQQIPGKKIKLSFSPQEQMLAALITLHSEQENPHPQYIKFMRDIIGAHLLEPDPHKQYALKVDAERSIKDYIDLVNRLLMLFISILGYACYAGSIEAGSSNTIAPDNFNSTLLNNTAILVNPEGAHEGWTIAREAKRFTASVFNRSDTNRTGFEGRLNWVALPPLNETPALQIIMPELVDCGVLNSSGLIEAKRPAKSTQDYSKCVFLMSPEGSNEGWRVTRESGKFSASIYNRSGINRSSYAGKVSYAVLEEKAGAVPMAYPGLLMSGVSPAGEFSIERPEGTGWDFIDPNYVLLITPEGNHEAWSIERQESRFNVKVYDRLGREQAPYTGRVNWAIFMKAGEFKLYRAGQYQIRIPAGSMAEVHLVGAGGSGAGSLWASRISDNWLKMDNGGDTVLSLGDEMQIIAGGGEGGKRGVWNNGSAYLQGVAGPGGVANIAKIGPSEILSQTSGEIAYMVTAHDWSNRDVRGGTTRWRYGAGGEGGQTVETRKHRCYGGGGGSGAYVALQVKNTTGAEMVLDLVVGDHGRPDTITNEWHNGKIGEAGCAGVRISSI